MAALVLITVTSCMSDKEYQLRSKDLKAKQAWPSTYQPVVIKGPLTIPEGGELVVTVPNQPYNPANIPDGQAIQAQLVKDVTTVGAVVGGAMYSIHHAAGTTHNTTINNAAAGE